MANGQNEVYVLIEKLRDSALSNAEFYALLNQVITEMARQKTVRVQVPGGDSDV